MTPLQIVLLALLAALLVTAMATDLACRIIPNRLNLAVAVLAIGWWSACGLAPAEVGLRLLAAAIVLGLFAATFALGWMGGGDVKLIAALALWLPALLLVRMLAWMAIGGGLLALAVLAVHRLRRDAARPEVPYGVAIAGAALLVVANDLLTVRPA